MDLVAAILKATEESIVPLTAEGVASGCKLFGAAILDRRTLQPLIVATNNEKVSPLLHGEINCIQRYFTEVYPDASKRPNPGSDCVFYATHEPCSLCLSGITWAGFSEFYYLFTYEDSRDLFAIPHDINILEQVFRVRGANESEEALQKRPLYNRTNKFFKARSIDDVVSTIPDEQERVKWQGEVRRVKDLYNGLSDTYQKGKEAGVQSASAWA